MFYRVILDCRPMGLGDAQPFISINFVEAGDPAAAHGLAIDKTRLLMREKAFTNEAIASFTFKAEEVELFDPAAANSAAEHSFIYYTDC